MDYGLEDILVAISLFILAALCEIGGGWLVWKWRRENWNLLSFIAGIAILALYGIIPTLQRLPFSRTYAAYGGFFVALSLLWGWAFDAQVPDRWDILGSVVAVGGVFVIMFAPREGNMHG
ncbi:hypothetical protein AMTRI_Chr06g173850 [Amborella trichopoda]|uniref:Uncharacterized protein n=1 Tax=Amborella trichopoda TaxID=13333 RepID=W1PPB1_AMBTC|nr:hypothetical protein AMTR_s00020p00111330 [Amborella trichopoda]